MTGYTVVEVWVWVDADGNYEVAGSADELKAKWEENIGEVDAAPRRLVRATLNVPTPKLVEVEATISEEPEGATVLVR